jgi:hypothetical protein
MQVEQPSNKATVNENNEANKEKFDLNKKGSLNLKKSG